MRQLTHASGTVPPSVASDRRHHHSRSPSPMALAVRRPRASCRASCRSSRSSPLVAGACSLTSSVTGPREWTQTRRDRRRLERRRSSSATRAGGSPTSRSTRRASRWPPRSRTRPARRTSSSSRGPAARATRGPRSPSRRPARGSPGTLKVTTEGDICIMIAIGHQLRLTSERRPLPAAQVTLEPAAARSARPRRPAGLLAREPAVGVDELAGRPCAVVGEQERRRASRRPGASRGGRSAGA